MVKFLKYLFIAYFFLPVHGVFAQKEKSFTLFSTGNLCGTNKDTALLNQWRSRASLQDDFAVLLTGNAVDIQTGQVPEELLLNEKHPLLLAPGKKEWAGGARKGKEFIKELKIALPENLNNPVFSPDEACPGPIEVVLSDHLVVILIDTWWWVHKYDRRFNKCGIETHSDVLVQIEDAIRRHYSGKHVVIAGHHSLKSYGNTSGYFSAQQWLLQLPYTFYRKLPGTRYDNQHPDFRNFRIGLLSVLKKYPDIVYLSAGEANLQYLKHQKNHFVISGSWQNHEHVRKDLPEFGSEEQGFAQLTFSCDGICCLSFLSPLRKVRGAVNNSFNSKC